MDTDNNDTLLVGDLMESMSLLKVEKDEESLKLSLEAVDNKQVWMTAVKFVNENVLIGADDRHNLFTMIKPEIQQEGKTCKLEFEGGYHLGTLVNRFRKGTCICMAEQMYCTYCLQIYYEMLKMQVII